MADPGLRLHYNGRWQDGVGVAPVVDRWSGAPASEVHVPAAWQVDEAVRALAVAQDESRLTALDRAGFLEAAAAEVARRHEELVEAIVTDTGFALGDAVTEVRRAARTLALSASAARGLAGHVVPLEGEQGGGDRLALTLRRPLGVVCAITPFNSPLNTVVHKLGPALAAGNAVAVKPAPETPLTADLLLRCLLEAGVPAGLLALLHGGPEVGQALLENPVPAFYAFTGSTAVGEHLARTIGIRRRQLELGSIASTLVCQDADLAAAARLCVEGAFRKAGQVCTSVQRLYVHSAVVDELTSLMQEELRQRPAGDPRDPATFVGPMISEASAKRVASWVEEAMAGGARLLAGGARDRSLFAPTILADVTPDMKVMQREVFGPVVGIRRFDDVAEAVKEANDTPFGLAAGVFTASLDTALDTARHLRFGAVHVNATSSSRLDAMPFGGVKASGSGREGPYYAAREMSEETLVTIRRSRQ